MLLNPDRTRDIPKVIKKDPKWRLLFKYFHEFNEHDQLFILHAHNLKPTIKGSNKTMIDLLVKRAQDSEAMSNGPDAVPK